MLERRDEFNLFMPSSFAPADKGELSLQTWSCIFISLPLLKTPLIAIAYDDVPVATIESFAIDIVQYLGDASEGASAKQWVYPSWQRYPQDPKLKLAFTVCKMANLDDGKVTGDFADQFLTVRRTYCGITVDFDANTLTDKGRLISGQFACKFAKHEFDTLQATKKPLNNRVIQVFRNKSNPKITESFVAVTADALGDPTATDAGSLEDALYDNSLDVGAAAPVVSTVTHYSIEGLPVTETQLTQMDSKVRQAEAKCGDYIPHRYWEPVFNNTAARDRGLFGLLRSTERNVDPSGTKTPTNFNIPLEGWGIHQSFWLDMHATSSLRVKRREGIEINTSAASDYSPFATPAYPSDARALTVFREFCREQPHSFESNFNSLGGMLSNIIGGIGSVLRNLNIPIVSDIAEVAQPILQGLLGSLPI